MTRSIGSNGTIVSRRCNAQELEGKETHSDDGSNVPEASDGGDCDSSHRIGRSIRGSPTENNTEGA